MKNLVFLNMCIASTGCKKNVWTVPEKDCASSLRKDNWKFYLSNSISDSDIDLMSEDEQI